MTLLTEAEYRAVYEFPPTLHINLRNKMDEFDMAKTEMDEHELLDRIEGAVETLNEQSHNLWVLQHFTAIHVDMVDILVQKKTSKKELLGQDASADPEDIARTIQDRRAFETQLDAVYRTQLAEITRLGLAEADDVEEDIMWRMDEYSLWFQDRKRCIRTFAENLEDMLAEEDEEAAEAIWEVMAIRHTEAFETFQSWMRM